MATRRGLALTFLAWAALACASLLAGCAQGGGAAAPAAGATNSMQQSPASPQPSPQQGPALKTDEPNGNRY